MDDRIDQQYAEAQVRQARDYLGKYAAAHPAQPIEPVTDRQALQAASAARTARGRWLAAANRARTDIERLPKHLQATEAVFTCRCPAGCPVARLYERRAQPEDLAAGRSLLLITTTTRGQTRVAWLASEEMWAVAPHNLLIGCKHGRGTFPTGVPTYLDISRRTTRRVHDIAGVTWTSTR